MVKTVSVCVCLCVARNTFTESSPNPNSGELSDLQWTYSDLVIPVQRFLK